MRVLTLGLLVFALGLGTAALLAGPGAGASKTGSLSASVGPGFTISMSASSVPAGDYTISVDDQSSVHNFHLSGPGVDQATDIAGTGSTSWSVTLQPGTYHFQCDAHASTMHGTLTVTGSATTTAAPTTTAATTTTTHTTTAQQTTTAPATTVAPPTVATTTAAATTTETATTTEAATTTAATTTGTSPAPLAARIASVRATRTAVTVSVSSTRHGHAVAQLLSGTQQLAHAAGAVPGRITLKLAHPLSKGRYTLRIAVSADGSSTTSAKTFRVG